MEQDPKQPIVGQFALWANDLDLPRSYWLLLLTNYGLYDSENTHIQRLLKRAESGLDIPSMMGSIMGKRSQLEVTLDFFIWLYEEDETVCFRIMRYIYDDFKDDDEAPDPYSHVDRLEDMEEGDGNGELPGIDPNDFVPATPRVFGSDQEVEFYVRTKNRVAQASEEVFIIDAYADEESIMYLKQAPEDIDKRILTQGRKEDLTDAAKKLVQHSDHRIEVRRSSKSHDRLLFVDNQCFAVGNSLHAAGSDPTYVVEFESTEKFRQPWEEVWDDAEEYAIFE